MPGAPGGSQVAHGFRPAIAPNVHPRVAALIERCWKVLWHGAAQLVVGMLDSCRGFPGRPPVRLRSCLSVKDIAMRLWPQNA